MAVDPIPAPASTSGRPSSRLEQLCNTPRSLSPFVLVIALVAGNGLLALSNRALERVGAAMLALFAVITVLRTLRTGTRRPFVAALVLTTLLALMLHRFAAKTTGGWSGVVTLAVDAYAIGLVFA